MILFNVVNRKNFLTLYHHELDFGLKAECYFSATYIPWQEAYDELGGTVKQLVAQTSLQRPYDNQIITPQQLYDWASTTLNQKGITFNYFPQAE